MSGFVSPFEEDNPFADMQGSGLPPPKAVKEAKHEHEDLPVETDPKHPETSSSTLSLRDDNAKEPASQTTPTKAPVESQRFGSARKSNGRKPIRAAAVASRLQDLDLENDPLGPLGALPARNNSSPPPLPPLKDSTDAVEADYGSHSRQESRAPSYRSDLTSRPNPEQAHNPSIPLERAANPTFQISVGDPTRIGDITSAHTVYKVSTKTTSHAFRAPEFSVTRRYRDFLWLYDQLNKNSPGAIVPPPPEKQAVGRFSDNFIEARRYALERMLEKISKHPIFRGDADFKLFLESETFTADIKQRPIDNKIAHESSRGFLGLGNAFSLSGKFVEMDEFFDQKKVQFDNLDHRLKALSRAVDVVIRQRKDLAYTTAEFGAALSALSTVELSKSLGNALGSLSDLQSKIQELHERQAQQDLMTLGHTVDEYIRIISSVKTAFTCRQKAWLAWQAADAESAKRRSTGVKIRRQASTQQDRLNMVDAEMTEAERRSHQLKIDFDNIGKLLKGELKRFDMDKVEDFKGSVEVFLESAVETQKEVIEHWEFYLDLTSKELDDTPDAVVAPKHKDPTTSAASVEDQDHILGTTAIEPVSPVTPLTSKSVETTQSSPGLIPRHEANPFAQDGSTHDGEEEEV